MAQTRGGAADVAMRDRRHRRPDDPVLLARHRADPAARQLRAGFRIARLCAVLRGSARQPAAHGAAGASRWRFRSSPICRASCARRCSTRSARTTSARPAPRALSERRVVYKHALRNALIPFVTSVGIMTGYLLGGAIVVEQVFAIPGPRAPHPRRHRRAQLSADPGDDPGGHRRLRVRQFRRRLALCRDRSAGEGLKPCRVLPNKLLAFALAFVDRCRSLLALGAPWIAPYDPDGAERRRAPAEGRAR